MAEGIFIMKYTEQQKAQFFLTSIYKKAWEDKTFLKNLIHNPIRTLNNFTGKKGKLPFGKVLIVEDQTNPNHIYLNLPAKPSNYSDIELNETQLDEVSGAAFSPIQINWNDLMNSIEKEIQSWFE